MTVQQYSLSSRGFRQQLRGLGAMAPIPAAEWLDGFRRDVLDRYDADCRIAVTGRYDEGAVDRAACLRDAETDAPTTPAYTAESVDRYWREMRAECDRLPCHAVVQPATLAQYDDALDGLLAFYQAKGVAAPRVGRTIEARSVAEIRTEIADLINRYIEAGGKPPGKRKGWIILLALVGTGLVLTRA